MRVLWLSHRDITHPRSGGAERTIFEVSRRLADSGNQVTVLASQFRGSTHSSSYGRLEVIRYGGDIATHLAVPYAIRSTEPDVVIEDLGHVVPFCSNLMPGVRGTVFFHHLHARTLPGQVGTGVARVLSLVERQYSRIYRSWRFVTESRSSVADLISLGIAADRIEQILPGVDLDLFVPGQKSADPSLVYFGGFRRYKRPELVLELYQRLARIVPALKLTMVGDGPCVDEIRVSARRLSEGDVTFTGRVSPRELARIVSRSWVNVHTSIAEGWGLSILEAAAAGTPTIAFGVSGVSEAVCSSENGFVVSEGDFKALSAAAVRVIESVEEWPNKCRRYAEGFSWDRTAIRWKSHLESLLT